MKQRAKRSAVPEWAVQITGFRERIGINQAELARRMQCSAMTISRWERGLLQPSAEHFIQLGNLGNKTEAWFFWEMAGIQPSKMVDSLRSSLRVRGDNGKSGLTLAKSASNDSSEKETGSARIPLLKAFVASHGSTGARHFSLRTIPAARTVSVPGEWCPNPGYTSLLRVKGRSMEPLICDGDVLAVDAFQSDRTELYGKIVVAAHEERGMCVSRLRRYDTVDVLQGEDRDVEAAVLSKSSGWRIMGKVLWWISGTP
jgi:SOS-response transcriptional repressor LexA